MRPIMLKVSGLQSFRKEQTIDFENLTKGGVFGIFGPTGSGKSSILDAITLALYGKVERAANGTQGIMNHGEDKLSVAFTFELGSDSKKIRYRVERSFKRTGSLTIRTATCRLLEIANGETVVHADKEREVTQQIQSILGLTLDDFTRAVVLPQGKFAEFLSLKGAERRQMLQRIFQLEQYGDSLGKKLKRRLDETKGKLEAIAAEQAGLGEASLEALKRAKEAYDITADHVEKKKEELLHLDKTYEEHKIIFEAQLELENVKAKLAMLEKNRKSIEEIGRKLEYARMADKLKPYGDELNDALNLLSVYKEKVSKLKDETSLAKSKLDEAITSEARARREKEQEEPDLIVRREQLNQAKELANQLVVKKDKAKLLYKSIQEGENVQKAISSRLEKTTGVLEKAKAKQTALKDELGKVTIASLVREKLSSAYDESVALTNLRSNKEDALKEYEEKARRFAEASRKKDSLEAAKLEMTEHIQKVMNKTLALYHEVCETEVEREFINTSLQHYYEELKREHEKEQVRRIALSLSNELREGEPCPVCGSTDHHGPQGNVPVHREVDDEMEQATGLQEQLADQKYEVSQLKIHLERLSDDLYTLIEITPETAAAQSTNSQAPVMEIKELEKLKERVNGLHLKVKGYNQDRIQLTEQVKAVQTTFANVKNEYSILLSHLDSLELDKETAKRKFHMLEEEWEKKRDEWNEKYPEYQLESIKTERERLKKMDERREEIEKSLQIAVQFIEQEEKKLVSLNEELNKNEREMIRLQTDYNNVLRDVKEQDIRLKEMVGESDLDDLLASTRQKLALLTKRVQQTEEDRRKAEAYFIAKDKEYHSAHDLLEETKKRSLKAEQLWKAKSGQSPFTSVEDMMAHLSKEEVQLKWQKEIEEFQEKLNQWTIEKEKLVSVVKDKLISAAEWEQLRAEREQAKAEANRLIQQLGEAKQFYESVKANHQRYKALEEKRKEVERLAENLGKLQTVFRGNSFVEFVAEEQLIQVSKDASNRLGQLTRGRYAIEVDSANGFIIRDDANGGVRRPVSSLSGGETFLTSLALALSLSAQIQLRGKYPLEFFFLDEGFGTLDQELLDTVVTALEKLRIDSFSVGVISHVPELQARLTRRLIVRPADLAGAGSSVKLEIL
ncbi:AAA family ATPase [Fictibacillus sp. Mic-4]|uniref:SbcC/MukB-like Walker B domain-containing protein n=1 Tax=Fictibacillus sp. Mic-4 TaxID=3132826 RepID=UPI003CEA67AF